MKMSKVGNQTNSQDPQAVNSRVFVGNLNTFQCSKTDVERMFQRYGRLVGEYIILLSSLIYNNGHFHTFFFHTEPKKKVCLVLKYEVRTIVDYFLNFNQFIIIHQ